tara:strand:+ start:1512 stop:1967 length:456 start_codon:yes stop_codon:yes gene_type:complete
MTVYAIAIVDSEGDCRSMYTPGAIPEDEGMWDSDPTKILVHITSQVSDHSFFANTHYYKDGGWISRDARPGEYYNWINEAWVSDSARLMEEIRQERDRLLYSCDWTQLSDAPLTNEKNGEWGTYRQHLRDVPADNSSATDLGQVAWPTPPT